jgi:F-box-like
MAAPDISSTTQSVLSNNIRRPATLNHYLSTNDVLPSSGIPTLNGYLNALEGDIQILGDEIVRIQAVLDARKEEQSRLKREHSIYTSITHPIRTVPPEVLSHIFAFTLGTPESSRLADIAHLRGVCSLWRQVTLKTPALWTSLTIDLHKWFETRAQNAGYPLSQIEQALPSCMATLGRKNPYHLILTSSGHDLEGGEYDYQEQLIQSLLVTDPRPGSITIDTRDAVMIASHTSISWSVTEMEITERGNDVPDETWRLQERFFSALKSLTHHGHIDYCESPFAPSSLHTLHLCDIRGEAFYLRQVLLDLTGLVELKLSSKEGLDDESGDSPGNDARYVHHSLQTLIISHEDLLLCCWSYSFPSLRLLGIHGHGLRQFSKTIFDSHLLTQTLARSSAIPPLLVSLRGCFDEIMLSLLLTSLPPESHLHLDISRITSSRHESPLDSEDEDDDDNKHYTRSSLVVEWEKLSLPAIYCGEHTSSLWWIRFLGYEVRRDEHLTPSKIYLTEEYEDPVQSVHREFYDLDLELETVPKATLASTLRSLAPQPSKYSKTWWNF